MIKVITSERIPIKMWLSDIEKGALNQAKNLANLPFSFKHIALMPDCHQGYGMPIGGVLATLDNIVVPFAVGADIGCGMVAVKTSINVEEAPIDIDKLKCIKERIKQLIPTGVNHQKEEQDERLMPQMDISKCIVVKKEYKNALKQLGTLGANNHFIEIQKGSDNYVYIMIHSGSRNLGYKVAKYYNEIAIKLNRLWYSCVPKEYQLAFLPLHTPEGSAYFREMSYCVKFAFANRALMMNRVQQAIKEQFPNVEFDNMLNVVHNYAAIENHFGKNVIVHRKGATRAYKNELGIIPGSQGSCSYIVKGKGCRESFMSCSHGAGRSMSITQAVKTLSFEKEIAKLNKLGTLHSIENKQDLGEATSAYKDIDIVMNNQKDLVDVIIKLIPLATIKGKNYINNY